MLCLVIQSFACGDTQAVYEGRPCARFANLRRVLERKLQMLDAAHVLDDLRVPPGNRLESLVGDRAGQHAIHVNEQFRLCFRWTDRGPTHVECVDYH
jgi:proteic killer suppression protein